nr:uncharacterized protein LOC123494902 [Aegilops tauschii subsp. strangulata]
MAGGKEVRNLEQWEIGGDGGAAVVDGVQCCCLSNLTDPPTFILLTHAQLTEQVQALQRDKEILKTNLNKAEEEVKLLFEENRALDEANKRLLCLLEKEQKHRSERKHSASNSTKVKSTNQP